MAAELLALALGFDNAYIVMDLGHELTGIHMTFYPTSSRSIPFKRGKHIIKSKRNNDRKIEKYK